MFLAYCDIPSTTMRGIKSVLSSVTLLNSKIANLLIGCLEIVATALSKSH
jgi:hypothetical protein